MRYPQTVVIDPRKVLPSRHSIFIRGFPSSVQIEDVKNLFTKESEGNCRIDFFSYSEDKGSLFVAVRFESHAVAKQLISKYDGQKIFGHKVDVTWFKDIRKARKKVIENEYKYHRLLAQPNFESWRRPYGRFPSRRAPPRRYAPYTSDRYYDNVSRKRRMSSSRSSSSSSQYSFHSNARSSERRSPSSSGSSKDKNSHVSSKKYRSIRHRRSSSSSSSSSFSASSRKSSPMVPVFSTPTDLTCDATAIIHMPFENYSCKSDSNEHPKQPITQPPPDAFEVPTSKPLSPAIENSNDLRSSDMENSEGKIGHVSKRKRSKRKKESHKYRRSKHRCRHSNGERREEKQQIEQKPVSNDEFYQLDQYSNIPSSVRSNGGQELQTDMDELPKAAIETVPCGSEDVIVNRWEEVDIVETVNDRSNVVPVSEPLPLNSIFLPDNASVQNSKVVGDTVEVLDEDCQQLVSTTYDTDSAKDEKEVTATEPNSFQCHSEQSLATEAQLMDSQDLESKAQPKSLFGESFTFRPFGVRSKTLLPTPLPFLPVETHTYTAAAATTTTTSATFSTTTTTNITGSPATLITPGVLSLDIPVDNPDMEISTTPIRDFADASTQVSTSTVNAEGLNDGCMRFTALSDKQIDEIFQKKRLVEAMYRVDCESCTKAVGKLIRLNPDLKDRLTTSLKSILEERAKQSITELRDYIKDKCA